MWLCRGVRREILVVIEWLYMLTASGCTNLHLIKWHRITHIHWTSVNFSNLVVMWHHQRNLVSWCTGSLCYLWLPGNPSLVQYDTIWTKTCSIYQHGNKLANFGNRLRVERINLFFPLCSLGSLRAQTDGAVPRKSQVRPWTQSLSLAFRETTYLILINMMLGGRVKVK